MFPYWVSGRLNSGVADATQVCLRTDRGLKPTAKVTAAMRRDGCVATFLFVLQLPKDPAGTGG